MKSSRSAPQPLFTLAGVDAPDADAHRRIVQAVLPNRTLRALALVNRFGMPAPGTQPGANEAKPGHASRSMETTPAWKTDLVDQAEAANNDG